MNEKKIATSCVLRRAGSYDCSNQLNDNICALLSMINTIAHNICTRMGWTTVNYRINRPFNLNTMCEEECRNQRLPESPDCKCCLLRRYIKTIIMNEFPYVKISGLNITAVVTFVDYCFNQLFLQDNVVDLRETIKRQLSNHKDEECKEDPDQIFIDALTNIFTEIKGTEIKSITFNKVVVQKGKLFVNDIGSDREIRGIDIKNGLNDNLYGIIDEHGPLIYNLGGNQIDPSLNLDPMVLCRNDQNAINDFMEIYLANMKNDPNKNFDPNKPNSKRSISESIGIPIPINELFSSLSEEVKREKYINKYLTNGHTMVLKCIFEYGGKYWVYFKNSWGTNIGLNGEDIAPLDTFLNCTIFLTRFPTLLPQDELFEKNIRLQKLLLQQLSQKQNKAEEILGETLRKTLREEKEILEEVKNYEKGKEIDTKRQRVYRGKPTDLDTLAKKRGGNKSSSIKKTRQTKRKNEKGKKTTKRRRKMRKTRSKI